MDSTTRLMGGSPTADEAGPIPESTSLAVGPPAAAREPRSTVAVNVNFFDGLRVKAAVK